VPKRWTWKRGNLRKELDYIGSNKTLFNSSIIRDAIKSDHDLILAELNQKDLRMETRPAESSKSTTIKKDIREDEVIAIMLDRQFPDKPFVDLAAAKGLTQTQKMFYSDYESQKKLIREMLDNPQIKADFIHKVNNIRKEMNKDIKESQKGIRFIYEDTDLQRKYNLFSQKCVKLVPRLIQNLDQKSASQLMNKLRLCQPKTWFQIVKIMTKTKKSSLRAISFASEWNGDLIVEAPSVADYIAKLYKNNDPIVFKVQNPLINDLKITDGMMKLAIQKLSRNKASGLDLLQDS
jgi:hypothetical protein